MKFFWQKNEGVIFDDGNIIGPKVAHIYIVLLERERFLYLLSGLRSMSYEWEKIFENFLFSPLPKNTKYEKSFDVIFKLKCSILNTRTIYETMDPVFGLNSEI